MFEMLWEPHKNFPRINRGVHRKAANPVGAPALIWHLGIWRYPAVGATSPKKTTDEMDQDASQYIQALKKHLTPPSDTISFDDYGDLFTNEIGTDDAQRGNIATFIFRWNRIYCTIRIEVHTEYITITSTLDASLQPKLREGEKLEQIYATNDVYRNISEQFKALNEYFSCSNGIEELKGVSNELYNLVWSSFESQVINFKDLNAQNIGKVFADFRGIVSASPFPADKENRADGTKNFSGAPFQVTETHRPSDHRDGFPPVDDEMECEWARSCVRTIWPFIDCKKSIPEVEFTVSRMLDGRAIYASSLGQHNIKIRPELSNDPVVFYLHSYTDDRWQIGRLIDRLTQAGTSRLAAIIEIDALHLARKKIDALESTIRETRDAIHLALGAISKGKPNRQTSIDAKFNESQQKFAELNDDFMTNSIEYRLERSIYYLSQFDISVKSLRIKRLEGYQPYDEYVNRRF